MTGETSSIKRHDIKKCSTSSTTLTRFNFKNKFKKICHDFLYVKCFWRYKCDVKNNKRHMIFFLKVFLLYLRHKSAKRTCFSAVG